MLALCPLPSSSPPLVQLSLLSEAVVKDGTAVDFLLLVLQKWVAKSDVQRVASHLRKGEVTDRLIEFLPISQRKVDVLEKRLTDAGLTDMVSVVRAKAQEHVKAQLQAFVKEAVGEEKPASEIAAFINATLERENVTVRPPSVCCIVAVCLALTSCLSPSPFPSPPPSSRALLAARR